MSKDLQFVRRILDRDEDALQRFYFLVREITRKRAFQMGVGNTIDDDFDAWVEDAASEIFSRLVYQGKLAKYKGKARLTTFLFVLISRELISLLRKQKVKISSLDDPENRIEISVDSTDRMDMKIDFERFIEGLPEEWQEVLKLAMQGYSYKEVARVMGVKPKRVYKIIEQVKRRWREKERGKASNI